MNVFSTLTALRVLSLALIALGLAGPIAAQCPFERVKVVPASWTLGPSVECGSGISLEIAGVQVTSSSKKGCPLFVIVTPSHHAVEASSTPTRVVSNGSVAELLVFFKCRTTYFIFIPDGSVCEKAEIQAMGQLPLLRTEACEVTSNS